ncbi:JAB domain-containing protein [Sphingomonas sp. CJ20]
MLLPAPALFSTRVANAESAALLFAPLVMETCETLAFAYVDAMQNLLGMRHARSNCADAMQIPIRAVAADAIAFDACGVVMAHNHPSGDPSPSSADREATRLLARGLDALDVRLIDHLILARSGSISFRELGLL